MRRRALEVIRVFNEVVDYYDGWYETPMGRYVVKAESKALKHLLPPEGRGADVGGGTGVFSQAVGNGRWVICIDPALNMLRRARRRGVDAVCATAEQLPLRTGSLDFAFMVTVLEFLEDPRSALVSVREALRPGGCLVVMILNRESPWGELYRKLAREGEPVLRLARFLNLGEARAVIEAAGFRVVEVVGALDNPPDVVPSGEPSLLRGDLDKCGALFIKALANA